MSKIKYDLTIMNYMKIFENLTRADLKDCIPSEELLIFVVQENEIGKAIGKNGSNVKRLEGLLKKKLKIVEFNPDINQFIRNFVMPLQVKDVSEENGIIQIAGPDTKTKGLLIGRDRKNLESLKEILKRYFSFEEVKVV
ncbi:MAG: NusA-like transcription termination signal-binding factor [Nanoarchaeota archaeon]|nr:NusA-like transcription termination signal-binding factor [Nanoarchaeota archaeon]